MKIITALSVALLACGLLIAPADAVVPGPNPVGNLESASWAVSRVTMSGWAFDANGLSSAEMITVYQVAPTVKVVASTTTVGYRADVNRAYGVGGNHGWRVDFLPAPGRYTFCAWAVNIGLGANTELGCRAVAVPVPSVPVGNLESSTISHTTITMIGWAFDRDDLVDPEAVQVWQPIGTNPLGRLVAQVGTTIFRPDVNAAYRLTGNHGWKISFTVNPGVYPLCVYAVNVGAPAVSSRLGCRTVQTQRELIAWGDNVYGQLGDGTSYLNSSTAPRWAYGIPNITAVAGSASRTIMLAGDGSVWGVGTADPIGPTGPIPSGFPASLTPVRVAGLSGITHIAAGAVAYYAIRNDGTVWAWGGDDFNELGDGTKVNRAIPQQVGGITNAVQILTTDSFVEVLTADGHEWSWGEGSALQSWSVPVGTTAIAGRLATTELLLQADGTVSWRDQNYQVQTMTNAVQVAAAGGAQYVLRADGTIWSWGSNASGQLGQPASVSGSDTPQPITGLSNVISIVAADDAAVYALTADGTLWAWGHNSSGQLGLGYRSPSSAQYLFVPRQIALAAPLRSIWAAPQRAFGIPG